jgi:hypothetical protein
MAITAALIATPVHAGDPMGKVIFEVAVTIVSAGSPKALAHPR